MTTEPQTTLKSGQTTEEINESLKTKSNSILCERCKIQVPNSLYPRHMQIHNVAERFTSNELLASLVLTTTEIKVKLDKLLELKAYELAAKRSR